MQLRSDIQLKSMIKALRDVIIPAIDPANRLALEQAQLVTGMLGLMQHQLPLQYRFDRDELRRLVDLLHGLKVICELDPALAPLPERYKGLITTSREVLDGCAVDPQRLHDSVRRLREVVGEVVTFANVLNLSREQLLRDRALGAPQGWEPDPTALPSIESLLSTGVPS
jgi:hypothetical protein